MSDTQTEKPPIDTFNKFLVGVRGDDFVFLQPLMLQRLSKADALLLAAFIVAINDDDEEWQRVLTAVQNT